MLPYDKNCRHIRLGADSSLLRSQEPLFLDDTCRNIAVLAPALRICRLGTHIPLSAAAGYVDAFALTAMHYQNSTDDPCFGISDRSFSPGQWLSPIPDNLRIGIELYGLYGNDKSADIDMEIDMSDAMEYVAAVSALCTLKTGDIVVLSSKASVPLDIRPNQRLLVHSDGREILNLKIK